MTFNNWLDTLVSEKGLDTEQRFDVEGVCGTNSIPYGVIVEHIKKTCKQEQKQIRKILVQIDFANGDIKHFLRHLGQAIAI